MGDSYDTCSTNQKQLTKLLFDDDDDDEVSDNDELLSV